MNVNGTAVRRSRVSGPTRALGTIVRGESVRIVAILSPALREMCRDIGLHEGDVVQCRGATGAVLLTEVPAGHIVALSRERASAIRVTDFVPDTGNGRPSTAFNQYLPAT